MKMHRPLLILVFAMIAGSLVTFSQQNVPFQNNIPVAPKGLANRPLPKMPVNSIRAKE
jgi:hypothetical protein